MKTIIEINMDNAAFEDEAELPRILKELGSNLDRYGVKEYFGRLNDETSIRDINGNTVGYIRIEKD